MTHEEAQELLGALAVDAVDRDEAEAIEAHVEECPRCRAELAELRETASLLGHASHTAPEDYNGGDAPDGLWDRIASSLTEAPPPLRLEVQRARSRRRLPVLPVGTAVAAAAVIVALSVGMVNMRSDIRDLRHERASDVATTQIALAAGRALGDPDARVARLTGTTGRAALAVVGADGQAYLLASSLPRLDDRIYEIWGATSTGEITALGTIPGPGVYAFAADPSIERVMLTREDKPVSAPTSDPVVAGTLA